MSEWFVVPVMSEKWFMVLCAFQNKASFYGTFFFLSGNRCVAYSSNVKKYKEESLKQQ